MDDLHLTSKKEEPNVKNKRKSLSLKYGDEVYTVTFINEGSKLFIEAKTVSDILTIVYSKRFTLDNIKENKYFKNDMYESIDDCLGQIFANIDKNESKIEKNNESTMTVKVPLYNQKVPFIDFPLNKYDKKNEDKIAELYDIVISMKKRIDYLENLLKIKKNEDYKKGLENFNGSVIEMTCFGRNEIHEYFDLNQNFVNKKNQSGQYKDNTNFVTFVFKCKDEKDIPYVVEAFKDLMRDKNYIFTKVEKDKMYVEIRFDSETDIFEESKYKLDRVCFSSGESLLIKTEALPKDMFEEYDEEKILNFILGTELEFKNVFPQIQIFANFFQRIGKKKNFDDFFKNIIKDIFMNLVDGNKIYKVTRNLIEKNDDIKKIYDYLGEKIYDFVNDYIKDFKPYKKVNFDEFEINLISSRYRAGFNYKFKVPHFNELVDGLLKGEIPQKQKQVQQQNIMNNPFQNNYLAPPNYY